MESIYFREGRSAALDGYQTNCPYPNLSRFEFEWLKGWHSVNGTDINITFERWREILSAYDNRRAA